MSFVGLRGPRGVSIGNTLARATAEEAAFRPSGGYGRSMRPGGRPSYETEAVAMIGKAIRGGARPLGVHVNISRVARFEPQLGKRPNRYHVNASNGQAVSQDAALVVTYARELQERGDRDYTLVQAGVRHRPPGTGIALGLAAGFGMTLNSPRFQVAFAV